MTDFHDLPIASAPDTRDIVERADEVVRHLRTIGIVRVADSIEALVTEIVALRDNNDRPR